MAESIFVKWLLPLSWKCTYNYNHNYIFFFFELPEIGNRNELYHIFLRDIFRDKGCGFMKNGNPLLLVVD